MKKSDMDLIEVVNLFNGLFAEDHRIRLEGGGNEPFYKPPGVDGSFGRIVFTRDYMSSALHEIAHWCIAGLARRMQPDYGYWYHPDGRSATQQYQFEQVESKPQAIEWIFSEVIGTRFYVSADNLTGEENDSTRFKQDVLRQTLSYLRAGMPERAAQFAQALMIHCGDNTILSDISPFRLENLN